MQARLIELVLVTVCCGIAYSAAGADSEGDLSIDSEIVLPSRASSDPGIPLNKDGERESVSFRSRNRVGTAANAASPAASRNAEKDILLPPATDEQAQSWMVVLCALGGLIATLIPSAVRLLARRRRDIRGVEDYLSHTKRTRSPSAALLAVNFSKHPAQGDQGVQTPQPSEQRERRAA